MSRVVQPSLQEVAEYGTVSPGMSNADLRRLHDEGRLPPLAGGSGTVVTAKVLCYPKVDGAEIAWERYAERVRWEELAQIGVTESSGVPETDTTTPKRGLHVTSATAKETFNLESIASKLPRRKIRYIKTNAASIHVYGRTAVSKSYEWIVRYPSKETIVEQTNTANAWKSTAVEGEALTELSAHFENSFEVVLKGLKANASNIFVFYLEATAEYEVFPYEQQTYSQAVQRAAVR